MRVMVIFDLPVVTKMERKLATSFRKFLLDDGFEMLQYSVYTRLCPDRDNAYMHLDRIKKVAPRNGSIRMLMLTEHQFADMYIVVGEKNIQEVKNTPHTTSIFLKISIKRNYPNNRGNFVSKTVQYYTMIQIVRGL